MTEIRLNVFDWGCFFFLGLMTCFGVWVCHWELMKIRYALEYIKRRTK